MEAKNKSYPLMASAINRSPGDETDEEVRVSKLALLLTVAGARSTKSLMIVQF